MAVTEILLEKTRRLGDGSNLNLGVSAPNIVHPIVTLIRVAPSGKIFQLHWNPSIVNFFVKAKSLRGFPLMRVFSSEKSIELDSMMLMVQTPWEPERAAEAREARRSGE